ncbi:unnamed protein product (macronuclear) [Paramecium tetraurelia]|uniref:40S ribosomal protein S24 n=1 Tax=Paramecium tetraurelia TaxID=5888 RepID=A0CBW3_PARTE|nr:uncharacterized protein GSPATT00037063001 [Paramecium tetraurelia]CAK68280.1 unnamed protein product [Paramecium tetraurelia]|eukprot:XP_001435677.1 hypothetical protein (macronuclear) [Paramecium tetraurelia strain d4-2]
MTFIVKTRKVLLNKLLNRRQLSVELLHPNKPTPSQESVVKELAQKYKADERNVVVYGLRTTFGGNRTTGFALIYDTQQYLMKFEPKFRLRRRGIIPKRDGSRKGWKEVKSKLKKTRGAEKTKIYMSRKTDKREVIRVQKETYLKGFVGK